ncbi:MAG: trehalose-6-phosphate synthase [Myxococcales bacterium]|nr:trehalose-6-phosphate synthase [Myxococcales bacterium]
MSRAVRFGVALVLGLALLTYGASVWVQRRTREWFDKDLSSRAEAAVTATRRILASRWDRPDELGELLADLAHDERVLAAAACTKEATPLASSSEMPAQFSCQQLGPRLRPSADAPPSAWAAYKESAALPDGAVHVSAIPVVDAERALGFVVLLHDLSFVERREAEAQKFLLLAFAFLAAAASALTVVAARLSWRSWSDELRRFLKGGKERPEFQPILRDVRELVERIVEEKETDREGGAWNPARLKQALVRHLHGEKVVILANREPYIHERAASGEVQVLHPASGLVTALEPVMRACSGVWIAHGSGNADRQSADGQGRLKVPPGEESYLLRRVWLSPEEERGYYYGFSNEGLWPLCHIAHARPVFRSADFRHYEAVNQKFAEAVCEEVDSEDPIVLVQDYHFALAPRMIRERLPRSTVLMFWHIPWPNSERFGICPWRDDLLEGMLGASILGFHTQFHCNNFIETVDCYLESRIDREQSAVVQQGRSTLIRPYPISVEWPIRWLSDAPPAADCRAALLEELRLPPDALLGVGVDRLDYTKGVEERLLAVERLLERFPSFRGKFTFVQLAAPSRTAIPRYQQLNEAVESLAERINQRFGQGGYRPVILKRAHHEPPAVFRYYRAADLCYVSSLHDGMNLVAKEFVAARDDERGVLVLSQFTGAAREMTEALIVNPYDLDEASAALKTALEMSLAEQRERMRSMRTFVAEFNVYRWAGRMLADAARLRRRDRLTGRLSDHLSAAAVGG